MNNDAQFTDKRLANLREPDDFAPNAARALRMVAAPPGASARAWITRAAIAAAMLLILLSLPAMHARAQSNSESGFAHLVDHVEWMVYAHWQFVQRWWSGD